MTRLRHWHRQDSCRRHTVQLALHKQTSNRASRQGMQGKQVSTFVGSPHFKQMMGKQAHSTDTHTHTETHTHTHTHTQMKRGQRENGMHTQTPTHTHTLSLSRSLSHIEGVDHGHLHFVKGNHAGLRHVRPRRRHWRSCGSLLRVLWHAWQRIATRALVVCNTGCSRCRRGSRWCARGRLGHVGRKPRCGCGTRGRCCRQGRGCANLYRACINIVPNKKMG
jgi:hypothetical protein